MKLGLICHGTTACNLEEHVQRRVDEPLCAEGRVGLKRLALSPAYRVARVFEPA